MKYLPFLSLLLVYSCGQDEEIKAQAKALIYTVDQVNAIDYTIEDEIVAEVTVNDFGGKASLSISAQGLIPNWSHAIHIHLGNCESPGAHWNRGDTTSYCNETNLGEIWAKPKAGDVGNIVTDSEGYGFLNVDSEFWGVNTLDERDLVGALVIIHEGPEDFAQECFQVHNHVHSNRKIACGTIELK